jgi:hypothetical protein
MADRQKESERTPASTQAENHNHNGVYPRPPARPLYTGRGNVIPPRMKENGTPEKSAKRCR